MRTVQIDDNAGHWRGGAVQSHTNSTYAVGVQGEMFLLRVGYRTGEHKYKPVRVDRRLNGGLYRTGEDDLDHHVPTITLHLQLLDLSGAACCVLRRRQQGDQREHKN